MGEACDRLAKKGLLAGKVGFAEAARLLLSARLGAGEGSAYVRVDNGMNVEAELTPGELGSGLLLVARRVGGQVHEFMRKALMEET